MATNLEVLRTYSFDVHTAPVTGNNFKNVTLLGIVDYETAGQYIDVVAQHRACYPFLPSGLVDDYTLYRYLKIKTQSGAITCLAYEWVRADTIVESQAKTAIIKLANVSPDQQTAIRNALVLNGFPNPEIEFV